MTADAADAHASTPRVVLVESAESLPGLLPFQAWEALTAAQVVYVRDPSSHPAVVHLQMAGIALEETPRASLDLKGANLLQPGDPTDRRIARGLLGRAAETGSVTYLLGPDDGGLQAVVAGESPAYDAEIELVFMAQLPAGTEVVRLVDVMRQLRDPQSGCPWDLEQDHESLKHYLLEEVYELLEAIDDGWDPEIQEELGDVLLQVVFHAQVARDRDAFAIDDVAAGIADKLVRRHPHVFGDVEVADASEVQANWDRLKADEKDRESPFEGVPMALPALMLSERLQRKAAKLGFEWEDVADARAKVADELAELDAATDHEAREQELGDLLGAVVGLARMLDIDAEDAMRRSAATFRARFEALVSRAQREGVQLDQLDREEWLARWEDAKQRGVG